MSDLDARAELIMQYFSGAQLTVKAMLAAESIEKDIDKLNFIREYLPDEWDHMLMIAEKEAGR